MVARRAAPHARAPASCRSCVGTAAAGDVIWWRFGAALLVAAGLQIGVNFANDYFDGVRGVDTHERLGPPRLTQSGRGVATRGARSAALALRSDVAAVAGLALALATTPVLILVVGALRADRARSCTRAGRARTPGSASAS